MKTKNQCKRIVDLVSSNPERATDLPEELMEHVGRCAACQVEVQAAKKLAGLLKNAGGEFSLSISPRELANRARAGRPHKQASEGGWLKFVYVPLGVAAVAAMVTLFIVKPWSAGETRRDPGTTTAKSAVSNRLVVRELTIIDAAGTKKRVAPTGNLLTTRRGERAMALLSDDTTLWLNRQSQVSLSASEDRKMELLGGEVFLDVVRQGSLPPLVVKVPSGRVQVVGTRLNINARKDVAVVDVLRGKVMVRSGGQSVAVSKGGEAVMIRDRAPLLQAAADLGTVMEWTSENKGEVVQSGFGALKAKKPGEQKNTEQALRLIEHSVKVKIQGRIVRTEVEEEFHNDTATTMEGIYSFPLPADAKIAGLDLVVDGKWEHGAMVERSRGDKIWAGVIRNATPRKKHKSNIEYIWVPGPWRDPALLNWKQGSDFELKIFPIPAKGSRRVRIAYTQVLKPIPGGRRYVLPLAQSADGKAATERFRFEASVGGFDSADDLRVTPYEMKSETIGKSVVLKMDVPDFAPKGDIVVDVPSKKPDQELFAYAYRKPGDDKGYAMIALKPRLPFLVETQGLDLLLVVDTSYSIQKTRLERAARLVELMSTELGNKSRVAVMTCASTCKVQGTPFIHPDKSTAKTLRDTILAQRSLGSTRLSHMMEQAAAVLKKHGITGKNARIIYMGDGVPTVGELDAVRLATKAGDVLRGVRLTTVGLGGTVDEVTMRAMARACGGAFVNPVPGTSLRNVAYRILQRQWGHPLRNTSLTLPEGAVQVAPGKLGDVWPGEERLVAFRLDKNKVAGEVILKGKLETGDFTRTYKVTLRPELSAGNAFLPRMWAERRIDSLSGSKGEKAREEIVKISRKHHVLSRYTSLIVLESAAMAKAFGVEDTRPSVEWSGEAATEESAVESPMDSLAGGSGGFTKDFRSAPRKASRRPSSMGALSSKPRSFMDDEMPRRERFRRRRPGSFVAMRKVWYRVATVVRYPGPQAEDWSGLKRAELKRSENAQSRERNRDLVRALIKMGELDKAEKIANHWLSKDRLDAGALVELSSIAALRGDTELGTLYLDSALDVDPRNKAAHTRMFQVYRAAGNFSMMCDHAIARSILDGTNMDFAVEATRCDHDKARHFGKLSKHLKKRAENLVLKATNQGNMWERLMLDASWETNTDLDLVVISPSGRVISWLGGAKRTKTKGVKSTSAEKLSVSLEENGKYTILAVAQKGHTGRVKGTLKISSYNAFKAYPFDFTGQSVRVAEVSIRSKFRYERVR